MLAKIAYQILFLQPLMAQKFLLDLEVVQLMVVGLMLCTSLSGCIFEDASGGDTDDV